MGTRSTSALIIMSMLPLSAAPLRVAFASPTMSVLPFSASYQSDTNDLSFKVYFNVTDSGSVLDYVTFNLGPLTPYGMDIHAVYIGSANYWPSETRLTS